MNIFHTGSRLFREKSRVNSRESGHLLPGACTARVIAMAPFGYSSAVAS